ncbi:MAG: cation transporter [Epulopiscium sp.]|nr:cation transporter [Candidatus Epulonipiscium sp.]
MDNYKLGKKVSIYTIIANLVLTIIKLIAGTIGNSSAIVADGIHTASDVITTVIVILGLSIASKEPDKEHPYGHEKFESAMAKLVSMFLFATGLYLGYKSSIALVNKDFTRPGRIALVAAAVSIIIKEIMYRYTIITAKKIESIAMEADAWHHRSDAFSSIGTFIGVLGARLGFPFLDPLAAIVVSIFIMRVAINLYMKSIDELVDKSADSKIIKNIRELVLDVKGVKEINNLKTRVAGNRIYVDLEISVNGNLSVEEGHDIAENVHNLVTKKVPKVKDCMVHIEPF